MLKVWKVRDTAVLPIRMTDGSVGYDICSARNYCLYVGDFVVIDTGLIVKPPDGYHIELALRSSLPKKHGLSIPHGFGLIDQDYCGEKDVLGIPVHKFAKGSMDFFFPESRVFGTFICEGDRIAQIVVRKTEIFKIKDYTGLPFENKTRGGFGSTGV